jgi:hypothetical protein
VEIGEMAQKIELVKLPGWGGETWRGIGSEWSDIFKEIGREA